MKTIKLQGIYADQEAREVKTLKVGDVITWNFGYKSEVVGITPSKTGKTVTLALKSFQDGLIRERKMNINTLVVA